METQKPRVVVTDGIGVYPERSLQVFLESGVEAIDATTCEEGAQAAIESADALLTTWFRLRER